jgi:3-hydroxymyristoyl/3-hydroxydecanoyl-(acyl carrier protein) dehydratase
MSQASDPRRVDWQWLDGVSAVDLKARTITSYRDIGAAEWYLEHHFPGFPVLPGVFLIEAMAHGLGVLQGLRARAEFGVWPNYVLAQAQDVRFYNYARPGDRVELEAEIAAEIAADDGRVEGRVSARVGDRKVARARLVLHKMDPQELADSGGPALGADPFGLARYVRRVLPREQNEALWRELQL